MSRFRCFNSIVVGALLLGAPLLSTRAQAQAQQPSADAYKQHVELAVQLFQQQYFDAALQEFQKAYSITRAPRLLFNMGQALLKLGRPKDALTYFERYKQSDEAKGEEPQRLLSRILADAQVQLEAERVLAEQTEREQQEKLSKERALADKEQKEREQLRKDAAALRARVNELVLAKSQRSPLSDPDRRRVVFGMLALSGVGFVLSVAGTATLALDSYPTCDRANSQQLCPTHLESKLPGGIVLGVGLSALVISQTMLGLSLRPTKAEKQGDAEVKVAANPHAKPTP